MKLPWPRLLLIANVVVLVAVLLFAMDYWVRIRVGQGINGYHVGVVIPMATPRPASPAVPPTK